MALVMAAAVVGCASEKGDSSAATSSLSSSSSKAEVKESIGNLDLSEVSNLYEVPADFKVSSEAEKGKISGKASILNKNFVGKYTGTGFVALGTKGDEVSFTFDFKTKGSYDIVMRLASDNKGAKNVITVDGTSLTSFKSTTESFGTNTAEKVIIDKGKHTIGIKAIDGHIYIDNLKIQAAKAVDTSAYKVSNQLSNKNASDNTKRLFNFLTDTYGKYIISGQYSGDNEGKDSREITEIKKYTGKTPAMLGLDVLNLSNSALSHEAGGGDMVPLQAIDWYNNENGIVSLCWHWYAPMKNLEQNGAPWWKGFYSEFTDFDLAAAMNGTDKSGYDSLVKDLDHMAKQLKALADKDVPILWRPLHEAAGDPNYPGNAWFWWGSAGKDAYLKLWKLMYKKFTEEYKLNNIIWVWNAQNPEWYPGDEYVDVIGYDCYPDKQDNSSQKDYYDLMKSCTKTNKIIAMTENGTIFDTEAAMNDGTRWAWFSTWNGEFTLKDRQLSGEYTSKAELKKIYSDSRVLTLENLPKLKNYPLDTEKYLASQSK